VSEPDPFFAEQGWQIVRGAVGAEVLTELLAVFDQIFPQSLNAQPAERTPILEVAAASRAHPAIARYATDAGVAGHVARALGCRRVQLLQDTVLLKLPRHGGGVEWHQDHTYTGFLEPAATVSVRLALTDCLVDNGCLRVIDGSHRWGFFGDTRVLSAPTISDALGLVPAVLGDRARAAARSSTRIAERSESPAGTESSRDAANRGAVWGEATAVIDARDRGLTGVGHAFAAFVGFARRNVFVLPAGIARWARAPVAWGQAARVLGLRSCSAAADSNREGQSDHLFHGTGS
jgi:hypothetical protein